MEARPNTILRFLRYTPKMFEEQVFTAEEVMEDSSCLPLEDSEEQRWLSVCGAEDAELLAEIGERYGLHHLLVEDLLHPIQRPKLEEYEESLVIVTQILAQVGDALRTEQLTFVLKEGLLLTFQERAVENPLFESIFKRLQDGNSRLRRNGVDYLMYAMLDVIVDHHLVLLDQIEEETEDFEEALLIQDQKDVLVQGFQLRQKLTRLRQKTRPTRELIEKMLEEEHVLIRPRTFLYLRDTHDHTMRMADRIESIREMLSGVIEIYNSQLNVRMSEIMKLLTMISAVFVPLNLIAAIYGMNFKYMPELNLRWMYFVVLAAMGGIAGGMLYFFKKKDWL